MRRRWVDLLELVVLAMVLALAALTVAVAMALVP